jgi:hypothetical protein
MVNPHKHPTAKPIDFWLARGAVLVVAALQIGIVNDLTVGPRWLAPCLELALLVPLSVATAWTQKRARKASTDEQWNLVGRDRRMVRHLRNGIFTADTFPLTVRAKLLMMAESVISLATIALVASRAVGILS